MKAAFPLRIAILALCLIAGCATKPKTPPPAADTASLYAPLKPRAAIRIGGSDAAFAEVIAPVQETFEDENPSLRLEAVQGKAESELAALGNGSLDAIVSTLPLERLLSRTTEGGEPLNRNLFREVPIGKNQTVIYLNRGIKVKKLTKKQLKGIFTGKITNWKKAGGPNRHVVVVWSPADAGEDDAFIRQVLEREPVAANYVAAANAEEVRKKVMETPGAIGIGPNALVTHGLRVPHSPTVASSVVMITKGEPSPQVKKLLDLIEEAAFLQ
ncbi:substrate-binding domain-containing protein [Geomonas sp. Red32]|uniref:substrate-binding domain-containing protein n=1 Tax=Geomonas sp. Red32 TaxID=2912856 RepID=UPI00202CE138|nr:substrate-binding domain-containing protein [Geomonas sp. Red32]MCM0084312.1 substrate-binding domain-containing protein [Geomonas sp. Red32]